MDKKEYLSIIKKNLPKENKFKNYFRSFLVGGTLGALCEILKLLLVNIFKITISDSASYVLLFVIMLSCFLTGLGFFDKVVTKYRCGLIIPITGFAHSIMSSSLDYKHDGLITGLGSNVFKLAGSVLLYGTISGFFMGIIKVIINV